MAPFREESFSKFTFKWCFLLQICVVETCNFIHISPILSRNTFIRSNNACRPVVWEQSVGLNMAYFFIFILNIDLKMPNSFSFLFLSWEKQWMGNDPLICKVLTRLVVLSFFYWKTHLLLKRLSPSTVSCLLSPSPVNSLIFHYL